VGLQSKGGNTRRKDLVEDELPIGEGALHVKEKVLGDYNRHGPVWRVISEFLGKSATAYNTMKGTLKIRDHIAHI
jgi:hypothetical protein